jgi:hypothetical protein
LKPRLQLYIETPGLVQYSEYDGLISHGVGMLTMDWLHCRSEQEAEALKAELQLESHNGNFLGLKPIRFSDQGSEIQSPSTTL